MNLELFKAADFFMMRTPLYPIDLYKNLFRINELNYNELNNLFSNEIIIEAINVSSLSLYESMKNSNVCIDNKCNSKIVDSFIKYLIRMSTRTTPYGLFSGINVGFFDDSSDIKLSQQENFIKSTRIDMEWCYKVIKMIEKDESIMQELKLTKNNIVYETGSRLKIPYISNMGDYVTDKKTRSQTSSITNSNMVKYSMSLCENPMKFIDLFNHLKDLNKDVEDSTIKNFIYQLLENEYLISELRPPIVNTNPLNYILDILSKLKFNPNIYFKLIEIKGLIEKYNKTSVGQGEDIYNELITKMKLIIETKDYVQVDMKSVSKNDVKLNKKIKQSIEEFASLFYLISEDSSKKSLMAYKQSFEEKYGIYREVPLLELMDSNIGLGFYDKYANIENIHDYRYYISVGKRKSINKYLYDKIIDALKKNINEVKIEALELDTILDKYELNRFTPIPSSMEIYANIIANSCSDIDNGDFLICLGPTIGSNGAGKSFGRFSELLDDSIHHLKKLNEMESDLNDNEILVTINETPMYGRHGNVTTVSSNRKYEINLSTNNSNDIKSIALSDLYVGIDNDRFFVKSKTMNKKIKFKSESMINPIFCSDITKFLIEISDCSSKQLFSFLLDDDFLELNYIPRISYKNIVLIPEQWKLSLNALNLDYKSVDKHNFHTKINEWISNNKIPQYIFMKESSYSDNRLLLNLDVLEHLDILFEVLKKDAKEIIFTETLEMENNLIAQGSDGKYFSEFIIPLVLNKNSQPSHKTFLNYSTSSNYINNRANTPTFSRDRCFLPGSEWVYIKLYGLGDRTNEFIGFELLPFCETLKSNNEIEKFFFLRYSDKGGSLRLRLKLNKSHKKNDLLDKLNIWFNELINKQIISSIDFDSYFREIERYGGNQLIDYAENIFCDDSIFVSNIIKLIRTNALNLNLEEIAVIGILSILNELGLDYYTQKDIFITLYDKNEYRDLFNKKRNLYLQISDFNITLPFRDEFTDRSLIIKLLELRKKSLNSFAEKMNSVDKSGNLTNSKLDIVLSIIHMFCNRLNGNLEFENKVMCLTRHCLQSLQFWKDKQNNLK